MSARWRQRQRPRAREHAVAHTKRPPPRHREEADAVAAPRKLTGRCARRWLPDPLARDLIIVPQTQIDREDRCTLVRCAGDEEGKDSLDVMVR